MQGLADGEPLGLRHNHNLLVPYDPRWVKSFGDERNRLTDVLGDAAEGIEHYGSTSVPGLPAKPILDILVGVPSLSDWIKCHDPLLGLGYDYAAHAGVPEHHIFGRGRDNSERTHLLHVVQYRGESWSSNLAFRDGLRADPALRDAYLKLKIEAIAAAPEGRADYNARKAQAISRMKARLQAQQD